MAWLNSKSRRHEPRMAVAMFCAPVLDDRLVRFLRGTGLELLEIARRLGLSLGRRDADGRLARFVRLSRVVGFFRARRLRSRQQAARRWCVKLPRRQHRKVGRRWYVARQARLPDAATVEGFLRARSATEMHPTVPATWRWWTPKDFERTCDSAELLRRWCRFRCDHAQVSVADALRAFAAGSDGRWARKRGLGCSYGSFRRYSQRLNRDGNIDARGRWRRRQRSAKRRKGPRRP